MIWMIEQISIYILACLIMCLTIGSVLFFYMADAKQDHGEEILKTASELMKEHKIRTPVEIYCNPWILIPMVYGIKTKKILLPTEEYTRNELRIILLHELIHIKHKDIC